MAKSKKTVEPYKDAEQGTGNGEQGTGPGFEERGSRGEDREEGTVDPRAAAVKAVSKVNIGFPIGTALRDCLDQVDPEIAKDNPVWKWALCDDHCTFVFRDGRKAVINF